jgi:hypothetical protein
VLALALVASASAVVTLAGETSATRSGFAPISPRGVHAQVTDSDCRSCHPAQGHAGFTGEMPEVLPPEADWAHWWFGCTEPCHTLHDGTTNLDLVPEVIETPNSGPRAVVFLSYSGPNSYADGDAVYDGVCEVCHTLTGYHRNDASGDHSHYAAGNCSICHSHNYYFQPVIPGDHPQATSDCGNCHLNPDTGEPDLIGVHGNDCMKCHTVDLESTILGPLGTWQGECEECHDPSVPETGTVETPTKGHRCVLCHGEQRLITSSPDLHYSHMGITNCVVCHGEIPDLGFAIGSGDREPCKVCHGPADPPRLATRRVHLRHGPAGASCFECHADQRPPVDIVDGPPVGTAGNSCDVCHRNLDPDFAGQFESRHAQHTLEALDCGTCHASAEFQDDREPMPPIDDPVRGMLDRQGYNECAHCHAGGASGTPLEVHATHVANQWQWCHDCHEASDPRPSGLQPPVTEPAESCALCHDDRTYANPFPFNVHRQHSGDVKCYACHQLDPALSGWPVAWTEASLVLTESFEDLDADGFGDPNVSHASIDVPPHFVENDQDCDPAAGTVYPGAPQVCDGVNNDCLDPAWPGLQGTNESDDDGDLFDECGGDCDDANAAIWPGAPEVNDGIDNQCPGFDGFGQVDEVSGSVGFPVAGDGEPRFSWDPQGGTTAYEVVRATAPDFSADCVGFATTSPPLDDVENPPTWGVFYYLVRATTPFAGDWGVDSAGQPRLPSCATGPPTP